MSQNPGDQNVSASNAASGTSHAPVTNRIVRAIPGHGYSAFGGAAFSGTPPVTFGFAGNWPTDPNHSRPPGGIGRGRGYVRNDQRWNDEIGFYGRRPQAHEDLIDLSEDNRSAFQRQNGNVKLRDAPTLKLRATFDNVISSAPEASIDCFSDVKLICEDKTFNCHRLILAQKSDTFQGMFANGGSFAEGKSGEVKIEDITAEVMQDVLCFIYCGYVETNLDTATPDMEHEYLYAAHKYQLADLVELVLLAMKDKLSAATACRYLLYADRYSLAPFKLSCYEVLTEDENKSVAAASEEWKIVAARVDLMTELYLFQPPLPPPPPQRRMRSASSAVSFAPSVSYFGSPPSGYVFGGPFVPPSHDDNDDQVLVFGNDQ